MRKLEFDGVDSWDRPVYKDEEGRYWKDVNLGNGSPDLHRSSPSDDFEGEPDYRIKGEYILINQYKENPHRHDYMMLDMMRSRCDYYLGHGNRNPKNLSCDTVAEHITAMKKMWNDLPEDGKPEWLTWEQILEYERRMMSHE